MPSVPYRSFQEIVNKLDKMTKANEGCFKSINIDFLNLREKVKVMKKSLKSLVHYLKGWRKEIFLSRSKHIVVCLLNCVDNLTQIRRCNHWPHCNCFANSQMQVVAAYLNF